MTATPIERALCCGATCGRTRPEHGECVASTHGRKKLMDLEAAGYTVVAARHGTKTKFERGWQERYDDLQSKIATAEKQSNG